MIFSLVEGKKDAYAEMSIGHKIISAIADDGKAVVYYIATTVLTSGNATIAAPAAAVFVTVGEETVKVVVK